MRPHQGAKDAVEVATLQREGNGDALDKGSGCDGKQRSEGSVSSTAGPLTGGLLDRVDGAVHDDKEREAALLESSHVGPDVLCCRVC